MPPTLPLLHPAPPWRPNLSEYVVLWHGCTALAKTSIEASGIDLSKCAADSDFGRGFYTTTLERQARLWAWDQFYSWRRAHPRGTANQPVVLRFRVRRYSRPGGRSALDAGLDTLESPRFVRGDYESEDYWSLVQHCRRSTPRAVRDHRRPPTGWYQLVCGPVAAFWRQRVVMAGADQFSFHEGGTGLLDALIRAGKGKGKGGQGDPDFYRWEVVV